MFSKPEPVQQSGFLSRHAAQTRSPRSPGRESWSLAKPAAQCPAAPLVKGFLKMWDAKIIQKFSFSMGKPVIGVSMGFPFFRSSGDRNVTNVDPTHRYQHWQSLTRITTDIYLQYARKKCDGSSNLCLGLFAIPSSEYTATPKMRKWPRTPYLENPKNRQNPHIAFVDSHLRCLHPCFHPQFC